MIINSITNPLILLIRGIPNILGFLWFLLLPSLAAADSWHLVNGQLDSFSVGGDGTVWGITHQQVYRYHESQWIPVEGHLTQIAVGNAQHIWGVDEKGKIYQWIDKNWQAKPGHLKQIAVGNDGSVWGIDTRQQIYHWITDPQSTQGGWMQVLGILAQIAVGNANHIWGVAPNGGVYQLTVHGWLLRGKNFKQVAVGHDGTVWAINAEQQVFRHQGNNHWVPIYGQFQQIAVGRSEQVWGIDLHGGLFQLGPSIAEYQALQQQLKKLREAKQLEQSDPLPLAPSPVPPVIGKKNSNPAPHQPSQHEQVVEQNQILQQQLMVCQAQKNGLQIRLNELIRLNKTRQYQISILQQQNHELQKQVSELQAAKQESD